MEDIVDKYYNTHHRAIKVNVKSTTLVLKIIMKILNLKLVNIFAKGYIPNWLEEVFVIKKVKNTVPWMYIISDFNIE